ncbi:MAG: endolytic transglycosylase MltG [Clostridia bacterium]|nr:endolytic transglycosylase MltG [Clostridia bacterium]
MANGNDYNELLSGFEDKKSAPAPVKKENSGAQDKANLKGGVYFSNPPRAIDSQAQRAKTQPRRKGAARKINVDDGGDKKKNPIVRFFTSKGFKRFAIMVAVIAVVSTILCYVGIQCINDVLALNAEDTSVEVTIQEGVTDSDVLDLLKEKDLIENKAFCKIFLTIFDVDGNYIPGVYTLNPKMGVEKMIATMKTDYTGGETISLTFPEGYTVYQIAEKLELNGVCTASSFITTLKTVDFSSEYEFIASITDKEKRFCALEGYIFPDTYDFYVGENASSVVRRFLDNFESKWTDEYQAQAEKLGKSVDEIVIIASMIQAEAASTDQMADISSVLHNRLNKPSAFPWLDMDSTKDYVKKTIMPELSSSVEGAEQYAEYERLYDTYHDGGCEGLPVGAIGNPGASAIHAALFPSDTNYYYFCHNTETGKVYYASSNSEHNRNKREAGLD